MYVVIIYFNSSNYFFFFQNFFTSMFLTLTSMMFSIKNIDVFSVFLLFSFIKVIICKDRIQICYSITNITQMIQIFKVKMWRHSENFESMGRYYLFYNSKGRFYYSTFWFYKSKVRFGRFYNSKGDIQKMKLFLWWKILESLIIFFLISLFFVPFGFPIPSWMFLETLILESNRRLVLFLSYLSQRW